MVTKKLILCGMVLALLVVGLIKLETNIYYLGFVVPASMFVAGYAIYSVRHNRNHICGFMTGASTRNEETWEVANSYCGRTMMKWSVVLLFVVEMVMLLMKPTPFFAEMIMLAMLIPFFIIMAKTERLLNKTFDRHGNRKEITQ